MGDLDGTSGYIQPRHDPKRTGKAGIELCTTWHLSPRPDIRGGRGPAKLGLQKHLDCLNVALCPHLAINDLWITNRICWLIYPENTPMKDPMNHKPHKKKCPYCETVCQVVDGSQDYPIVETKRFFWKKSVG